MGNSESDASKATYTMEQEATFDPPPPVPLDEDEDEDEPNQIFEQETETRVAEVLFPDNVYVGELDDKGLLNGEGIQNYMDGRRYSGQFSNNVFNGDAVMVWPDGHKYVGQYDNNQKSGDGSFTWPDGRLYDGQWHNGLRHGYGRYSAAEHYVGDYVSGMRHGDGVLTWPDGKRYSGQFFYGAFQGYAVMSWLDGRRYLGQYKENQKHGDGLFLWPDGRSYEGQWAKGYRHGMGHFIDKEGREHHGLWRKDKLISKENPPKQTPAPMVAQVSAALEAMKAQQPLELRHSEKKHVKLTKDFGLNFHFVQLSLGTVDQEAFKKEFLDNLLVLGAAPKTVSRLNIQLSEGSIVAGVLGPAEAMSDLRKLDLDGRVSVMGDLARVVEAPDPVHVAQAEQAADAARAIEAARVAEVARAAEVARREELRTRRAEKEVKREERRREKRLQTERAVRRQMLIQQNQMLHQQLQHGQTQAVDENHKREKRRRKPPSQRRGSRERRKDRPRPSSEALNENVMGRQSLVDLLANIPVTAGAASSISASPPPSESSVRQHPPRQQRQRQPAPPPPQHTMSREQMEQLIQQPQRRREKPPHQARRYAGDRQSENSQDMRPERVDRPERSDSRKDGAVSGQNRERRARQREMMKDSTPEQSPYASAAEYADTGQSESRALTQSSSRRGMPAEASARDLAAPAELYPAMVGEDSYVARRTSTAGGTAGSTDGADAQIARLVRDDRDPQAAPIRQNNASDMERASSHQMLHLQSSFAVDSHSVEVHADSAEPSTTNAVVEPVPPVPRAVRNRDRGPKVK